MCDGSPPQHMTAQDANSDEEKEFEMSVLALLVSPLIHSKY